MNTSFVLYNIYTSFKNDKKDYIAIYRYQSYNMSMFDCIQSNVDYNVLEFICFELIYLL